MLPADPGDLGRPGRVGPLDLGHDVQRHRGHGQHPALGAQQAAHPFQALHGVAEQVPQGHDEQVAQGVPGQPAVAAEPVLHDPAPGDAPVVVAAQRGQGHPQVARGQHAVLAAQRPAGTAVVGHGHHRGQVAADPAQRRQGRGQPVPAAQRHHPGCRAARLSRPGHSRPRSRWVTWMSAPVSASFPARNSLMATLRCLPPVQPTASVTKCLPSRSSPASITSRASV